MWPRLALWAIGFLAVPAAKYIWQTVWETPSYQDEFEKINAERSTKEKADREELERLRNELSEAGRRAGHAISIFNRRSGD